MKRAILILVVAVLAVSCSSQRADIARKKDLEPQVPPNSSWRRLEPNEIMEFIADPIPPAPSDHFKNFKISKKDLEIIIRDYHAIGKEHWAHGYSHVAFGDRTGHLILKDGRKIEWMVRPAGLATLKLPDGKVIYLAKELTACKKGAEQAVPVRRR